MSWMEFTSAIDHRRGIVTGVSAAATGITGLSVENSDNSPRTGGAVSFAMSSTTTKGS